MQQHWDPTHGLSLCARLRSGFGPCYAGRLVREGLLFH